MTPSKVIVPRLYALSPKSSADISEQDTACMDVAEQVTQAMPPVTTEPVTPLPKRNSIAVERPFFTGTIPLAPSINQAYKPAVIGEHLRIVATPALEQFKRDAAFMLADRSRTFIDWPVLQSLRAARRKTPLAIKVLVYFASAWRRDLDGIAKHAIDSVFHFLQLNDNQIVKIEIEKLVDAYDPRIEVEMRCVAR